MSSATYTMQRLVSELVPDELGVSREEFAPADSVGSLFSANNVLAEADKANREIAQRANMASYNRLQTRMWIDISVSANTSFVVEYDLPEFVAIPVQMDAVNGVSPEGGRREQVIQPIYYNKEMSTALTFNQWAKYNINSDKLRFIQPQYYYYRLVYQRVPGPLCYGLADTDCTTTTIIVGEVEAGEISNLDDAYVGDWIGLIDGETGFVQRRKIIAFNADTSTFTVDAPFDSIPDEFQSWSILPWLPETFKDLIVYGTAARMRISQSGESLAKYQGALADFLSSIQPPENRTAEKPIQTHVGFTPSRTLNVSGTPGWPNA